MKSYIYKYLKRKLVKDNSITSDFEIKNKSIIDDLVIEGAPGVWSVDRKLAEYLISFVRSNQIERVVEFGAGYSTTVFKQALSYSDRSEIFSIEENPDWLKVPSKLNGLVNFDLSNVLKSKVVFNFGFFGIYARYDSNDLRSIPEKIDLVFVDGPQQYFGREGDLDFIFQKINVGGYIILDDAQRYLEACLIFKWLKVYDGLELIMYERNFGEKGLAIFVVRKKLRRRFSLFAFALGIHQGFKRYINVKFSK